MKAADKITIIRIALAPVFFIIFNPGRQFFDFSHMGLWQYWQIPALWIIFCIAELSDLFDGMIARKRKEESDFGKIFDPFADSFLQITLFFCFVMSGILPMTPFLLILYREFSILLVRNVMIKKGISMGARLGGKIKTVAYIITAGLALMVFSLQLLEPLFIEKGLSTFHLAFFTFCSSAANTVFYLALAVSILSFFDYIKQIWS